MENSIILNIVFLIIVDSKPIFIDETTSCRYLFQWDCPSLCSPQSSTASPASSGGKLSGGTIAVIVIAVLATVAVIAGVIIYRHKRQRRWDGVYEYTGVSNDDDTTMLVGANKGATPRFYDDDDDELIL